MKEKAALFFLFGLLLCCVQYVYAEMIYLQKAVPQAEKIIIGQVVGIMEMDDTRPLDNYPTSRNFERFLAEVRVLYPIKNSYTNETIAMSYSVLADKLQGIVNGPIPFEPDTHGAKYLMFLRKRDGGIGEFVALTDPYDSSRALIELSKDSEEIRGAKVVADWLLAQPPLDPIANYLIEYYKQLKLLVDAVERGDEKGINNFRKLCASIEKQSTGAYNSTNITTRIGIGKGVQADSVIGKDGKIENKKRK